MLLEFGYHEIFRFLPRISIVPIYDIYGFGWQLIASLWDSLTTFLTHRNTLHDVADTEDVDHVSGVSCFDPKDDIKVGDHTVPDWFSSYNTTATMPDRVKYYTWWRVDPLHNVSLALVSCADGSKPALTKFKSGEIQYEVSEATDLVRVMSFSDIFLDNSACSGAVVEPIDVLNRSLGFGSLLLALTELWRCSLGLPLLDHNKVASSWKLVDRQTWLLLETCTSVFLVVSPSTTNTAWTDKDLKIVSVIKDNLAVTDEKWTEHWYGGVVPWWYVQAVLTKFGGDVKLKTNTTTSVRLDVDEDWVDELGYHL